MASSLNCICLSWFEPSGNCKGDGVESISQYVEYLLKTHIDPLLDYFLDLGNCFLHLTRFISLKANHVNCSFARMFFIKIDYFVVVTTST